MMGRCSWDILCKRRIDKKKNFTRLYKKYMSNFYISIDDYV